MFNKRGMFSLIRNIYGGILDFVYPPLQTCPVCGEDFSPYYTGLLICAECLKRIPVITPPLCTICSRPIRGNQRSPCAECRGEPRFYRRGKAIALYTGMIKELLHTVKYDFRPELAGALGSLLAVGIENDPLGEDIDLIIPAPLHPEKKQSRGYNQAQLLATPVAKTLEKPLATEILVKVKPTKSQSRLSRKERKANISGAFAVTDCLGVAGQKILLIDDITTTGYTLSECARVLLLAGAKEISVLTVAIGIIEDHWRI